MTSRRFKYGIFLHPALSDPQTTAWLYLDGLLISFVDRSDPTLDSVVVRWNFAIKRVDDSDVFTVAHQKESYQLFADDESGPIRAGLLEALDWWNNETVLIAPSEYALSWNERELPNARTRYWTDGLAVQTISEYPKRLGHRVLKEWNPGLQYLPFEFTYTPPSRERELEAVQVWWDAEEKRLQEALAKLSPPAGTWYLARPQRYRNAAAPDPEAMTAVGSLEQAEAAAEAYRGPCFLVDAATGRYLSRWEDR